MMIGAQDSEADKNISCKFGYLRYSYRLRPFIFLFKNFEDSTYLLKLTGNPIREN